MSADTATETFTATAATETMNTATETMNTATETMNTATETMNTATETMNTATEIMITEIETKRLAKTATKKRKKQTVSARTFTRDKARKLCQLALSASTLDEACDIIAAAADRAKGAWKQNFRKLAKGLREGKAPFTIFTKGNSKLPFYSWSTLPEFTCPGAGECLKFCYSFTAWRYPAAFCRQLQNTLLLRHDKRLIVEAWNKLKIGVTVRLYVDGDIDSINTLSFWSARLSQRADISAYGYSKSWEVFEQWHKQGLTIPSNYKLNLSSGSKYDADADMKQRMAQHAETRGEFVCVPITGKYVKGFKRFENKEYHNEIRQTARNLFGTKRVFSCPGNCGACLPIAGTDKFEHACGSNRLHGVVIAIGEHN